jgi:hypothetical protein
MATRHHHGRRRGHYLMRTIPRAQYQEDLARGYTVTEFHIGGSITKKDLFTGRVVEVKRAPVDLYKCMHCQFNSTNLELVKKHISLGQHPWGYSPGDTPYGPRYEIQLEGSGDQPNQGESK